MFGMSRRRTHQNVVAGLSDEHLSNLAGNIEVGNLGSWMSSVNCAAGCAMTPASSEESFWDRFKRYNTRPQEVIDLEHAYMGIYEFTYDQLGRPELYDLIIQEQALRVGSTEVRETVSV